MGSTSKQKYIDLCEKESSIPIFSKAWWLDTVCGKGGWDVVCVEKGSEIVAALPYRIENRRGTNYMEMPHFSQFLGPWVRYPDKQKIAKKLSFEKKIFTELINKLPSIGYFYHKFHYSITNWLPFYWKGFKQTTRYTYVIEDIDNEQQLWEGFSPKIRTDIKKAKDKNNIVVEESEDMDTFLDINEMSFKRQNLKLPFTRDSIKKVDKICAEKKCRKIFFAKDENNRIHSAVYIVWDNRSAYYLMGGGDPDLRNSGATSLCLWEAIRFAATVTTKFDFEGSMIEPIETFFRAYGSNQTPYFVISKMSRKIAAYDYFKQLIKTLMGKK